MGGRGNEIHLPSGIKKRLEEFITSRHALREMIKQVLWAKGKWDQIHIWSYTKDRRTLEMIKSVKGKVLSFLFQNFILRYNCFQSVTLYCAALCGAEVNGKCILGKLLQVMRAGFQPGTRWVSTEGSLRKVEDMLEKYTLKIHLANCLDLNISRALITQLDKQLNLIMKKKDLNRFFIR